MTHTSTCSRMHNRPRPPASAPALVSWPSAFEPQSACGVPHGLAAEGTGAGSGPGRAGERPRVDGEPRHFLLQRVQVGVVHKAEHIQQTQRGEQLGHVAAGTEAVRFRSKVSF